MSSRYWSVTDCRWTSSPAGDDLEAERWTREPAGADGLPPSRDLADAVPVQRSDTEPVTA